MSKTNSSKCTTNNYLAIYSVSVHVYPKYEHLTEMIKKE